MEKDQSEIKVGSDLGNDSTSQEKKREWPLAEECRYEEINRAIKEGKRYRITWEVVPLRTLELMRKRGLLVLDGDDDGEGEEPSEDKLLETNTSGSGKSTTGQELNETGSAEEIVLPFTKTLDSWKEYELDEVYKRTPQRPHFRSLAYSSGPCREWMASGLTRVFIDLVKKVDDLREDAPRRELVLCKDTFDVLEEQGFDVRAPMSRIYELLSVKNGMEKEMADESSKEPKLNKSLESGEVQKQL